MSGDDLDGYKVELYIYDLSKGLARTMSPALLGKQLEGVWHTGVVAYGREYFFSSAGIESCRPGGTLLGEPDRIEELGESQVPYQLFLEYIFGLGESSYKPGAYNLFKHNCNNFSDEISQFLCGQGIPKSILQLPEEVLNTPLGESLSKIVQDLQLKTSQAKGVNFANFNNNNVNNFIPTPFTNRPRDDPELDELDDAIEEIRNNTIILEDRRNSLNEKLSKRLKKERKKEKKERKEKKKKTTIEGEDNDKKKKKKHKRVDSLEESEFVRSRSGSAALPPICPNQPSTSRDNSQSKVQLTSDIADEVVEIAELTKQLSAISVDRTNIPIVSPNTESSEQIPQTNSIVGSTNPNIPETTMADPQEERIEATAAPVVQPLGDPEPEVEREPPIVFKDEVDTRDAFDHFVEACAHMLTPDEQHHMEELRAYVVEDEGSWALGENFSILFFRVFHDPSIPDAARLHLLRIMAAAALKDDVILLLHQDRKEHTIMNYANKVESVIPEIQEALALFFCNMFEHLSPSEWLLYISEWDNGGQQISNIRVTTKIAVNALLHSNAKVQALGTALMYNLGTKEVKTVVFDDVAPELAMAILQYLNSHPEEEQLWRSMTALCRFCYASSEVPMLVKMIGPSPDAFKGVSERVDNIIEEINIKLSRVRGF